MPKFIIETTIETPAREFWQVEAADRASALEKFEAGEVGTFLWDEVTGDETERNVEEVHAFADLAGTVARYNLAQEAPAMVEALRKVLGAHGHWETEGIIEARAILERIEGQKPRYCVDGLTHADPDTAGYWSDGEFAPFVIFDIQAQRNLPGEYATRAEAEAALARIDGEGGQ